MTRQACRRTGGARTPYFCWSLEHLYKGGQALHRDYCNPSPLPAVRALAQGVHAGCICACVDGLRILLRVTRTSLTAVVWAGPLAPLATTHRMQWRERLQRTLHLWPYMAPLALVYFAEYVLQVRVMPANLDDATVLLF